MHLLGCRGSACRPDRKPWSRSERMEVAEECKELGGLAERRMRERRRRRAEKGILVMESLGKGQCEGVKLE